MICMAISFAIVFVLITPCILLCQDLAFHVCNSSVFYKNYFTWQVKENLCLLLLINVLNQNIHFIPLCKQSVI